MRAACAWTLGVLCVMGAACQQIVGIGDRKVGSGLGGAPGLDGAPAVDSGGSVVDGSSLVDAPLLAMDARLDAGTGGRFGTGGVLGGGGALGAGGETSGRGGSNGPDGGLGTGGHPVTGGNGVGGNGVGGATTIVGTGGATLDASIGGAGGSGTGGSGTGGNGTGGNGTGGSGTGGSGTGGTGGCGDGVKGPAEQCDLGDLGGKTCASIGLGVAGSLGCASDCTLDTTACRPVLVMFGGSPNGGYSTLLGDTWEYANGAWQEKSPMNAPGERYAVGMASFNGTVLLFGGYGAPTPGSSYGYRNDTWTWDGNDWTLKQPAHKPSTRYSPAMGTLNGKVVLFGGWGGSAYDDTWEWDGNDWNVKSPAHVPTARDGAAMANVGGERLVMFGAGTETWEWDGNDWKLLAPATVPPDRKYLKAATLHGGVIMFGGATSNASSATYYSDTWRWNGSDWTQVLSAGPPGSRRSFAIGPLGGSVLMFGGLTPSDTLDDTWEFAGATWIARTGGPSQRDDVSFAAR